MVSKICVDPGHGMSNRKAGRYDPGAGHEENGVKYEEATIALQYGLTLRAELQARGKSVFMTRDDATDHAPVGQRAANAKKVGCDMLISLHLNDFDGNRGKTTGTAAFFSCTDSASWTLCIMCRRRPPFPR